mmetsp:Transcript_7925/g.20666  ORF Transcript_7925/g.20666 Transcript_7925/m.20666 type:complete len:274 (+) Transcript_7925:69-890(+)
MNEKDKAAKGSSEEGESKANNNKKSPLVHGMAGAIAGAGSTAITHPLDLIKTRFQVLQQYGGGLKKRKLLDAFRSIARSEGVRSLYKGLTPNLLGSSVAWGLYFNFYNLHKTGIEKYFMKPLSPSDHIVAASCAGAITAVFTNPVWLLKTRMQLQVEKDVGARKYRNILHAVWKISVEEGPLTFFRGLGPALYLVPHGAFQFVAYEYLRKVALQKDEQTLGPTRAFVAGVVSKIFAQLLTYPYQVVRAHMQQAPTPDQVKTLSTTDVALRLFK